MTPAWLPRVPARPGLYGSNKTEKVAVSSEVRVRLEALVSGLRDCRCIAGGEGTLEGCYYAAGPCGEYLVKILHESQRQRQDDSEQVAEFLIKHGIKVNRLLGSYPRAIGDEFLAYAYPFVHGHHGFESDQEARGFGRTLALVHIALAEGGGRWRAMECALERRKLIEYWHEYALGGREASTSILEEVLNILSDPIPEANFSLEKGQMLHGDLNIGNVLFPQDGSAPLVLDFETSLSSWGGIEIDLAQALERFVLLSDCGEQKKIKRWRIFLESYQDSGVAIAQSPGWLRLSLMWLSYRSLCLLCELEKSGERRPYSEWNKFVTLYERHRDNSDLLQCFEDCL